jgi:hypothetical protein
MKRAARVAILGLLAGLAAAPAWADCADEVRAARQKLPGVKDEARRKEAARLLDKAGKDAAGGPRAALRRRPGAGPDAHRLTNH